MIAGPVFALDISTHLGVAVGHAGQVPKVFTVRLKKPSEGREAAGASLIAFLDREWRALRPGLVFKEAPPALAGFARMTNSEATVRLTYGLHGIVEAMATRFALPCEERAVSSIRKHYIGSSGRGERQATKRAVIARGILLGYLPKDCTDDNMGDAVAAWDYACAHFARTPPKALHLFGEGAAA